ncbi:hypothetical protein RYX36_023520 [Vicia faba]
MILYGQSVGSGPTLHLAAKLPRLRGVVLHSGILFGLSVFVGDLAIDVNDAMLQEVFASRFSSIKGAKVVIDSNTGRSKGYGFVRFGDENERIRAMTEMNGVYCSSRPMRVGVATPKKLTTIHNNILHKCWLAVVTRLMGLNGTVIGKPDAVLVELAKEVGADAVYAHREASHEEVNMEEKIEGVMEKESIPHITNIIINLPSTVAAYVRERYSTNPAATSTPFL